MRISLTGVTLLESDKPAARTRSWHLLTLSEAHSVSAPASRLAGRCGLGAGTPAVAARAAVASLRALWVRAAGPRAREMALCS